jgi:energy-coupling factor transporter transmembrane protein EcfT
MVIKESTRTNVKVIARVGILLFLIFIFGMAVLVILNYYKADFIVQASIATVSLAIAIILPFRQKRFSFQSILLLIITILFVASATLQYTNDNFIRPLPILQQIELSKSIRLIQVSGGFANTGFGIGWFLLGITVTKSKSPAQAKGKKFLILFSIGLGISWLILGISSIFSGQQHL